MRGTYQVGFCPLFYFFGKRKMDRPEILDNVRASAKKAAAGRGFEFVHAELAGTKKNLVIRVFIDKPNGVTLDDCALLSHDVENDLDSTDLIPGSYVLEVSSPGLERELYSEEDFHRFSGKTVRIKTSEAISGKKLFKGTLNGLQDGNVSIDDRITGPTIIPYTQVVKANLVFDLAEELKSEGQRKVKGRNA